MIYYIEINITDKNMFYVYLLECQEDQSWYIGYTSNLQKRIKEHQNGHGCQTTAKKKGWKLIYYEAYINKQDAIGREKFLKSGSGRKYLIKQLKHYLNR
jgi:putative endonuclease